jgi:tape measure domain-containing protein
MSEVDNRIVKLGFDNKDFEKNVEKTQKSLKKLDESLKLEDAASKCKESCNSINDSLSGLNIDAINKFVDTSLSRFNVWGKTIQNVVDSVAKTAFGELSSLFTTVPSIIVTAGRNRAQNIENARFQLKGLGMDVDQIMDDANYAVSGTAYGLDQAAKAAAQFGASGIKAGEEMKTALRSISGVAAMTNTDFTEIARIFTAIAGTGRVQTIRIQQLSDRGLRVTGKLAEAYGVTEEEMSKMISKGKVDAKSFFKVMNAAFGEHATKANETYSGSLSNVRAALGRIGEKFESKKMESFRRIFVSMIPVINNIKNELMPFINGWNTIVETVTSRIAKLFDKIKAYQDGMKDSETVLTKISKIVLGLVEDFNKLFSAIGFGIKDGINPSIASFDSLISKISAAYEKLRPSLETLTTIRQIVARVTYTFKSLATFVGQIFGAIYDAITGNSGSGLLDAINGIAGAIAYLSSKIVLSESGLESIRKIFGGIASAFRIVFKIINPFANAISAFIQGLAGTKTNNAAEGLLGLISIVGELIMKFEKFLDETGILKALSTALFTAGKFLGSSLNGLLAIISKLVGIGSGKLSNWFTSIGGFRGIASYFLNIFGLILEKLKGFRTKALAFIVRLLNKAKAVIGSAYNWIKTKIFNSVVSDVNKAGDTVRGSVEKTTSAFDKLCNTIKIGITGIGIAIGGTLATVIGTAVTVINRITSPLKGFGDILSGVGDLFTSFSKKLTGDTFVAKANAIGDAAMKLGKAFAILSVSLIGLSLIDLSALKGIVSSLVPLIITITLLGSVIGNIIAKKKIASSINNLAGSISNAIRLISGNQIAAKKKTSIGDIIKKLIAGLLKFAISVWIIANIYKKNKAGFIAAVSAIGGFLLLFTIAGKVLSSAGKNITSANNVDKVIKSLSSMMIKLAIAINILLFAIKGFDPDQIWLVIGGILSAMTAIGGLMMLVPLIAKLLSNIKVDEFNLHNIEKLGKVMTKLSWAMIPIAFAIKMIAKANIDDGGIKSALSIALVVGAISLLVFVSKGIKPEYERNLKILSRIILSVGAMALLLGFAVEKFKDISFGQAVSFFGSMILVLGSAITMIIFAKKVSDVSYDTNRFIKSMTSMIVIVGVIGAALTAMALSFKQLAQYDWVSLLMVAGIVTSFMVFTWRIIATISKMQNIKTTQLFAIAAAITALGAGLTAMGFGMAEFVKQFKDLDIAQAISAVVGMIAMMVALGVLIHLASKIDAYGAIILAVVSLFAAVIGLATYLFGMGIKNSLARIQQFLDLIGYFMEAWTKLLWMLKNMDIIVNAAKLLTDNFNMIAQAIGDSLALTFDVAIGGIIEKLKKRIPQIKEIIPIVKQTLNEVKSDLSIIIIQLGQILGTIVGSVIASLSTSVWTSLVASITGIAQAIAMNAQGFANKIAVALETIIYEIADFFRINAVPLADAIAVALKEIVESVVRILYNSILDGATGLLEQINLLVKKMGKNDGFDILNRWIEGLKNTKKENLSDNYRTREEAYAGYEDYKKRYEQAFGGESKSLFERIGDLITGGDDENGKTWADKLKDAVSKGKNAILDGLLGDGASEKPIGENLSEWLKENGLSNLFGAGDANSLFGAENLVDNTNGAILNALNGINENTLATAENAKKIKDNTEEMTVSLDTGQVVGAIAPDMYDALGRIRTQKGRGN